jgi:predicted permease
MRWFYKLPLRFRSLFRKRQVEQELSEELRFHLENLTQEKIAQGMTREEARYAALRELGGAEQIKEECRDMRRVNYVESLLQDLRFGLRQLRRNPGFTLVAVITLALGIGATTAIFSVVNAALLHPLPFQGADRLVTQWGTIPHFNYTGPIGTCPRDYTEWRDQNRAFEQIAAFSGQTSNLTGAGEPVRLTGAQVTASLFPALGVTPTLGRTFLPNEDRPGNEHEVILSDKLWRSRFRSDQAIAGKSIKLDGQFYTVIGVMPTGFDFPDRAEFWTPVALTNDCSNTTLLLVARLRPGVSLPQARSEASIIAKRLSQEHGGGGNIQTTLVSLAQAMGYGFRRELLILLGAVGLLLLIACANVANLLLGRGAMRHHEMAIRNALGATRRRIIIQMLIESVLLAAFGGALGIVLAVCGHDFLASSFALLPVSLFSPDVAARVASLGVDRWVLGFTLVITLLTGIIFGLAPAIKASKPDVQAALKECGRSLSAGRSRIRSVLVVGEIAISLILLIGAVLLVRTLIRTMSVDPGFNPAGVLSMNVELPESRYHTAYQMIAFEQRALQHLRVLPGIRSAGGVFGLPLGAMHLAGDITIEGQAPPPPGSTPAKVVVAGDYFRALGIRLIRGRFFDEDDSVSTPHVAIISQGLARRFWPHSSAIGKRLKPGFSHDSWYRIVGVVGDVKTSDLSEESPLTLYLPYEQAPVLFLMRDLTLVVRTVSSPESSIAPSRYAIRAVDPELPVFDVATMEQLVYRSASEPRFAALLLGIFAALALVLASVGIYGVISYSVNQRTHEIGIRIALGASKANVLRLVLGQGIVLTIIGVGIGIAGAFGLTRFLSSMLYGVRPTDPLTFIGVSLILIGVALLACYVPARRATKVDPMVALRYE